MMSRSPILVSFLALLLLCLPVVFAQAPPVELGTVDWIRDLDVGLAKAAEAKKPVLLLFQEVPGCAGCQRYGKDVLSNPLLVAAIQSAFVPVAIRNNSRGDKDAETLKRFREPAWNYQVVRYLGFDGRELLPRKDKVWSLRDTAERMAAALAKAGRPLPPTLELVLTETAPGKQEVLFSMFCYYNGETLFGGLPGVAATESAWYDGREVVRVTYDPKRITLRTLIEKGQSVRCADSVYLPTGASDKHLATAREVAKGPVGRFDAEKVRRAKEREQKVHLQNSPLRTLELSPIQAARVNALLGRRAGWDDITSLLTPTQRSQVPSRTR